MRSAAGAALFLLVTVLVIVGSRFSRRDNQVEAVHHSIAPEGDPNLFVSAAPDSSWQTLLDEYDQYLTSAVRKNLASGFAVVVLKDTSVLFLRTYGIGN